MRTAERRASPDCSSSHNPEGTRARTQELSWTAPSSAGCDVFNALQFWHFAVCQSGRCTGWIISERFGLNSSTAAIQCCLVLGEAFAVCARACEGLAPFIAVHQTPGFIWRGLKGMWLRRGC